MTELNLDHLRKVAEAAGPEFRRTFSRETVLTLLTELQNARTTLEEDERYIQETDERMKPHLARAWDEGFSHATGSINSDDQFDNPYETKET